MMMLMLLQPTNDVTDEDFDKVFAVNVKAIYYSANVIVPYMQKKGNGGSFVTIASTAGIRPRPGLTWYNASKAAVINATRTMAVEYAKDNIRFNSVCPVVALGTGLYVLVTTWLVIDTADDLLGLISSLGNRRTRRHLWRLCLLAVDRPQKMWPTPVPSFVVKSRTS
jgi:NAD(P)-dependent dehydrogenase (short-subunit alcohol dehydrogenase family)